MKKRIAFIAILAMLLLPTAIAAVFVPPASASNSTLVYLDVSTATPQVGEEFYVNIMVSDVQNLWAWQAGIEWDPNALEYVSYAWGELSTLAGQTSIVGNVPQGDQGNGRIYPPAAETLLRGISPVSATTIRVLTVTLKAKNPGTSTISLINVLLKGQDSTSTTAYPGWGDANGDLRIDLKDLIIVFKYWGVASNYPSADSNGDGFLDVSDLAIASSNFGEMWDGVGPTPKTPTLYDIQFAPPQDISVTVIPDTMPPTTAINLQGIQGTSPWFTSDVTVTLKATDPQGTVIETDYSFDGFNWFTYTASFDIMTEGATTVYYYSVDNSGNVEPTKSETVYIDKTTPLITITSPEARDYLQTETLTLDFSASDTVSGLSSSEGALIPDPATIYIDPQYRTAGPNQVFSIDVCIADAIDVVAWQVRLKWDPLILNVVAVTEGDFLRKNGGTTIWPAPSVNLAEGWVFFGCALLQPTEGVSGSGTLATITFISSGEGFGTFEIMTDYPLRTKLLDRYINEIPFVSANGYFSIMQQEVHNIAITSISPSSAYVAAGETVEITVNVVNLGTCDETFDVSVSYDSTLIDTQTAVFLPAGQSIPLTFYWNTAGVEIGTYTIQAQASTVPGESYLLDNSFIDGPVTIVMSVISGQQIDLSTLEPGKYTFIVTAVDNAGNVAVSSVTFNVANTGQGTNVVVPISDVDLILTFDTVTSSGTTEATATNTGPNPPSGFKLGEPPIYYEITTTATYTDTIQIAIAYDEARFTDETNLKLLQWDVNTNAWMDVTTSVDTNNNIIYGRVDHLSLFTIVEPICGSISGVVTDEYTKQPIQGIIISILETGEYTTTNAQGKFSFAMLSPGTYTVEITVSYGYLTHDAVTKFVEVLVGKDVMVDFTLYQAAWSGATVPRGIGYWKNWDNHYTHGAMENLVTYVKSASGLFGDLTVDNLKSYLTITRFSTMTQKGEAQLLASWLNVVSAQLGVDVQVDITSIKGWKTVINDADGILSVRDLLSQIDKYYLYDTALTKEEWEIVKNILDALNNGRLFIP